MARRRRSLFRYWLAGDEQVCAGCEMPHASAVTVHCSGCDRNYCSFCVVLVENDHYCGECDSERGRGRWRGRSGKA